MSDYKFHDTITHRAWADHQRHSHAIEAVQESKDGWSLNFDRGMGCWMSRTDLVTPHVGDTLTYWGKGFGSSFRGQAIDGVVVWYRTEDEDRAYRDEELRKQQDAQRAEYVTKKADHDAVIAVLPCVFQERIAGYRFRNPDFGWKFEAYELMCCREAVRIATALRTPEAIDAFHALWWDEQQKAVPGLDQGHSGNSLGFACTLASLYLTHPELVPKFHGALSVLVGSEDYGDWACSEEARVRREDATHG